MTSRGCQTIAGAPGVRPEKAVAAFGIHTLALFVSLFHLRVSQVTVRLFGECLTLAGRQTDVVGGSRRVLAQPSRPDDSLRLDLIDIGIQSDFSLNRQSARIEPVEPGQFRV